MKLYTREAGKGQPMVLLHGNGEDGGYFSAQMEYFSAFYHVIAVDTRGHGRSPRGKAPFTLEQFAEDLREFLRTAKLKNIILLGFSDGGNIALIFALKYPQYVDRLILNGANLNPFGMKLPVLGMICAEYAAVSLRLLGRMSGAFQKRKELRHKKELLALMVWQPRIRASLLKRLPMPALVVAGDRDMIRQAHTERIARFLPHSRLRILSGTHFIASEDPAAFNRCVAEFLRDTEGGEARRMKRLWGGRKPGRLDGDMVRHYAVLIPLIRKRDGYHVLFEVRSQELKSQPGEICFPGGAVEAGESRKQAAVRETMEELKIGRDQIEVAAPLEALVTPAGVTVWPYLGILSGYQGTFSAEEVDHVFTMPLRRFAAQEPESYRTEVRTVPGENFPYELIPGGRGYHWRSGIYEVLFYRTEPGIIGGRTAKMLRALARSYREEIWKPEREKQNFCPAVPDSD